MPSDSTIAVQYSTRAIRGDDRGYTAYHAPRYAFVLELVAPYVRGADCRILDIGASHLTTLLRECTGVRVDSLGFDAESDSETTHHFQFDLNRAQSETDWRRDIPPYDIIVMAEVLEHLYTAPELVLAFVRTLIKPNGILIVQTPNATSLVKRLKMLLGRHPFERIRIDNTNPGHFREYAIGELRQLATHLGFDVERVVTRYYFDARYAPRGNVQGEPRMLLGTVKNILYSMLPTRLREGVTMVWRRRPA